MIIPSGINQLAFYKAARSKGIKIQSRYKGVGFNKVDDSRIYWAARFCRKDIKQKTRHFHFDEAGELAAAQQYLRWEKEYAKTNIRKLKKPRVNPKQIILC